MMDEGVDALDELFDGGEGAAADRLVSNVAEPTLDLVEPRSVGGREVHVIARMYREPGADFRVLVRGVVIDDQVQLELRRHAGVEMAQEREELLMAMPR